MTRCPRVFFQSDHLRVLAENTTPKSY